MHYSGLIFLRYLPVTLVSASVPLVAVVDAAVISTLGDAALIGGIAAAATIMNFLFFTLNFLRTSTTALVAQAAGAGDMLTGLATVLRAGLLAAGLGLLAIALQGLIGAAGLAALGIGGEVAAAADAYFGVRIWSVPAMLFNMSVTGWLLGQGLVGRAMLLQAMTALLSIAFCSTAVLGLGMGIRGVAAATVTAELTTALIGAALLGAAVRRADRGGLSQRVLDLTSLRRVLSVNGNLLVRSFALFVVMAYFTRESAAFGTETLAVNAVLVNLFYLSATFMDGTATAAQNLAGRAVGARSAEAFHDAARVTLRIGVALAVVIAAILVAARPLIMPALVSIDTVRAAAAPYYLWPVAAQLVGSVAFVCDGLYIGATWARDARNLMVLSALVFFAGWAVLTPLLGNHGLWLALLLYLASRAIAYLARMRSLVPATFGAR